MLAEDHITERLRVVNRNMEHVVPRLKKELTVVRLDTDQAEEVVGGLVQEEALALAEEATENKPIQSP